MHKKNTGQFDKKCSMSMKDTHAIVMPLTSRDYGTYEYHEYHDNALVPIK